MPATVPDEIAKVLASAGLPHCRPSNRDLQQLENPTQFYQETAVFFWAGLAELLCTYRSSSSGMPDGKLDKTP